MIGLSDADESSIGSNNPAVILPASTSAKTVNAKWADFVEQWNGDTIEGPAAAKKMKGVKLQIKDADGTTGTFKFLKLGAYGLCS